MEILTNISVKLKSILFEAILNKNALPLAAAVLLS